MSFIDHARNILDISPLDAIRAFRRAIHPAPKQKILSKIKINQFEILWEMRRHNQAASWPFAASPFWQTISAEFDETLAFEGIINPEEQSYNLRFSGFSENDPRLHRYVCWLYTKHIETRDKFGLLDKLHSTCKLQNGFSYLFENRRLSLDILLSIDDFYNLYELDNKIATEPVLICELGAGWGRIAHVVCQVNPLCTYAIFDLPETLLISQEYLSNIFSGRKITTYRDNLNNLEINRKSLQGTSISFFGPQDLLRVAPNTFDYSLNIASFQEMPKTYVDKYLEIFSRITGGGFFFSRQLAASSSHGHDNEVITGFSDYAFPQNWELRNYRKSTLSDQLFEIGFNIPSYAEN